MSEIKLQFLTRGMENIYVHLEGLSPPVFPSVVPVVSVIFMVCLSPPVLPSVISLVSIFIGGLSPPV
jgi:hypothetical protein